MTNPFRSFANFLFPSRFQLQEEPKPTPKPTVLVERITGAVIYAVDGELIVQMPDKGFRVCDLRGPVLYYCILGFVATDDQIFDGSFDYENQTSNYFKIPADKISYMVMPPVQRLVDGEFEYYFDESQNPKNNSVEEGAE